MDANQMWSELAEQSERELAAAEAELESVFAKAEEPETSDDELDSDFDDLDEATTESDSTISEYDDEDDEDDEDEDDEEEEEEDDMEEFAKAHDGDGAKPVDATPILEGLFETIKRLEAGQKRLERQNAVMAKAMTSSVRSQRQMVKAQEDTLGQPLRPKAHRVPTRKPEPEGDKAPAGELDANDIMSKAIEAIPSGDVSSTDVSTFNAYVADYGLDMALDLKPEFRKFVATGAQA